MGNGELGSPAQGGAGSCAADRGNAGSSVLRAKYRDYCSARVADVLLALSPDEIYVLAEAEARRRTAGSPGSYTQAVDLATQRVRDQLALPEFRVWATEYEEQPERFDSYLIGLWESEERGRD